MPRTVRYLAFGALGSAIVYLLSFLHLERQPPLEIRLGAAVYPDPQRRPSRVVVQDAYRSLRSTVPRQVQVGDLIDVVGRVQAQVILDQARLVYLHFPFANQPVRKTPPARLAALFHGQPPGLCDAASRMFARLLGLNSRNLNIITPKDERGLDGVDGLVWSYWAHTASEVVTENGAVLVDPTFGFVLVTSHDGFTVDVFRSRSFKMFTLFDSTVLNAAQARDLESGLIYLRAAAMKSSVALSGERMGPLFPRFRIRSRSKTSVGVVDGTNREFSAQFGGWGNHVGFWYEPTSSRWQFSPEVPGQYRVTFKLIDSDADVTKVPLEIAIAVDGAALLSRTNVDIKNATSDLPIVVSANGPFTISLSSRSVSARLIDAIEAERISTTTACGLNLGCYVGLLNSEPGNHVHP